MSTQQTISKSTATCSLDDQGRLCVVFARGARVHFDDAQEITAACSQLVRGVPRRALVDFRSAISIDWNAWRHFLGDPEHLATYSAVAIVTRTALGRLFGGIVVYWLRPPRPARLFTDASAAYFWLSCIESGLTSGQER